MVVGLVENPHQVILRMPLEAISKLPQGNEGAG